MTVPSSPYPFAQQHQLNHDLDSLSACPPCPSTLTLPSRPDLTISNTPALRNFLLDNLWAHELESVAHRLWVLSTPSSSHIRPLHKQKIMGRQICVTEEPRLHLVWIDDRIFIKPLPPYLLSAAFWQAVLLPQSSTLGADRERVCRSALGLLRSYALLIRHESDLMIAQMEQLRLVPKDVEWPAFCKFVAEIAKISDPSVSGRYLYGELRLSRLNRYAPLLFGRFDYQQAHGQFIEYFARMYGPVLFYFAIMTMTLSGMQVVLTGYEAHRAGPASVLWSFFLWFSVMAIFVGFGTMVFFIGLWVWIVSREWSFSYRENRKRNHDIEKVPHST